MGPGAQKEGMMGTYKEENLRAKAVREGIIEPHPQAPKAKRTRPVIVEYRWRDTPRDGPPGEWSPWKTWRKYISTRSAQQSIDINSKSRWRKDRYEYRLKEKT